MGATINKVRQDARCERSTKKHFVNFFWHRYQRAFDTALLTIKHQSVVNGLNLRLLTR